jgi:heptosyltransferase-3
MKRIDLSSRPDILVVALRRIGDVLLTTPLIRSLRRAWPEARIDALVFADTAGILGGNPDIDDVIAMPQRATILQSVTLATRLWKRYALAIATQTGDRPSFLTFIAGRIAVGPVEDRFTGRLKQFFFHRSIRTSSCLHRVDEVLNLADVLGIERVGELVPPKSSQTRQAASRPYAVIHAAPMYRYKQWTQEGWRALAAALVERGFAIVATGGPGEGERRFLDDIWSEAQVERVDGRLSWSELSGLLSGAGLYVGPDTSVTHLAAAVGCPTIALYGPTDPRVWGPWPVGGLRQPWAAAGAIQRSGNVWLVQNPLPCLPCQREGCERRLDSYSCCLNELSIRQVLIAVDQALAPAVAH